MEEKSNIIKLISDSENIVATFKKQLCNINQEAGKGRFPNRPFPIRESAS